MIGLRRSVVTDLHACSPKMALPPRFERGTPELLVDMRLELTWTPLRHFRTALCY